jgi:hypothetical protein
MAVTVNLDDGGIHTSVFHVGITQQCSKNPRKNVCFDPVAIATKHRVPLAELRRQVAPGTTRAGMAKVSPLALAKFPELRPIAGGTVRGQVISPRCGEPSLGPALILAQPNL